MVSDIQGSSKRPYTDFSRETLKSGREGQEIFQVRKTKTMQPILFYLTRLSFKMEGEMSNVPDKIRLKEYTFTKPALQDMLKGLL